jgi:WD40 repeat protein
MENIKCLKIFLGSYEGKIYTTQLDLKTKQIRDTYSFKSSDNPIKIISNNDNYIFTSGHDEIVHIYDILQKKEIGMFVTYSGSIFKIEIFKKFLFVSGDDHNLSIFRMSDFSPIHNLKGHKGSITEFIIHRTGRFCLSASKDHSVIIWNLLTGKPIIKYKFKEEKICQKLIFFKQQKYALLIFDYEIWLFDLFKDTENYEEYVVKKIRVSDKIFDAFVSGATLFIYYNNASLELFNEELESEKKITLEKPDKMRDLDVRTKMINTITGNKLSLLNVVFANNEIYIYDINKINKAENNTQIKKFRSINLSMNDRITCLNTKIVNT